MNLHSCNWDPLAKSKLGWRHGGATSRDRRKHRIHSREQPRSPTAASVQLSAEEYGTLWDLHSEMPRKYLWFQMLRSTWSIWLHCRLAVRGICSKQGL